MAIHETRQATETQADRPATLPYTGYPFAMSQNKRLLKPRTKQEGEAHEQQF